MARTFSDLESFRRSGRAALGKGPAALLVIEDDVELVSTLDHLQGRGFTAIVAFAPPDIALPEHPSEPLRVTADTRRAGAFADAVNAALDIAAPGTWLHYCYNAEYLFYPFAESRSVGELLAFHSEERRSAMLTYVIDLYADGETGVDLGATQLDTTGYYALARNDPKVADGPAERQLDFFGGLRWRFEEHVEPSRRRIDRIGLFRAAPGLRLRPDHTFSEPEYNTYACPWHNNLTAAICSFRAAKALRGNPISRDEVGSFTWSGSAPFDWSSRQLLDLGLIEPGQWV
ncbi:MAG: hypothetical protein AAFR47_10155 [Pseudomonadota bacterium]